MLCYLCMFGLSLLSLSLLFPVYVCVSLSWSVFLFHSLFFCISLSLPPPHLFVSLFPSLSPSPSLNLSVYRSLCLRLLFYLVDSVSLSLFEALSPAFLPTSCLTVSHARAHFLTPAAHVLLSLCFLSLALYHSLCLVSHHPILHLASQQIQAAQPGFLRIYYLRVQFIDCGLSS